MMRSIAIKSTALFLLVLGTSAHGQATGSAKGQFLVTHSKVRFVYNDASKAYLLDQMTTNVKGKMNAKGLLVDLDGPVNESTKDVIGINKDLHGTAALRLDLKSSTPKLLWEISLKDRINVVRVNASARFVSPLVITEGSIAGYKSVDIVVFDLSDEGAEAFARGLQEGLQEIVQSGLSNSALKPAMKGMKIKAKVKNIQLQGSMRIMVSKKQITISKIAVLYDVGLSAAL